MTAAVAASGLQAQMNSMIDQSKGLSNTVGKDKAGFGNMLEHALKNVNQAQNTVADLQKRFEMGDKNVSLSQVMLETQKSNLEFQALLQMRNKALRAYQDVMNLPW